MILFDGCSWTEGVELENIERDRFSTLVSEHYQTEHMNIAEMGKSNDGILRTTIRHCENNHVDVAVIQLTKISRREILSPDKGRLDFYCNRYYRINVNSQDDAIKSYYANLQTHEDDIANFYKNKFLLEHYFKTKNIKYFFVQLNRKKTMVPPEILSSWQLMSPKPVPSLYDVLGGESFSTPYFDHSKFTVVHEHPELSEYGVELIREELNPDQKALAGEKKKPKYRTHPNSKGHRKIADFIIKNLKGFF